MTKLLIALLLMILTGCTILSRPPPLPESKGPRLKLINCTDYPSVLVFTYPTPPPNVRLASMTTREFFTDLIDSDLAFEKITRFCEQE